MATLTHAESRPMYSWWWDSHIYPKTSKWLQENLTDVDAKVKKMITLIEEDADSFASRAEMFYEKRPELMKLVEELYRAYRALAERYDHATGALHQARRSIARAFPNQVPLVPADDYPCTPEMQSALFDPVELQKDVCEISISPSYGITAAKHHPKFFEGKARKGLNFEEEEEASCTSAIELVGKSKNEIQNDPFAKLEADKDAGLAQYEQALDRLSKLELEVSHAQEDSKRLDEQASKAETEVQSLRESLRKLDAEKEDALLKYEQCMDRIHDLENCISCAQIDYCRLETETQALKLDHSRLGTEKEVFLLQLQQSLDLISNLEGQLLHSEEAVARINESANKAESEVENLKLVLLSTTKEKDAAVLQCQQNSEKISNLEHEILHVREESQRLSGEKDCEMVKLKDTEERCFLLERSNKFLHSDLESMVVKIGSQSQELIEKQKEIRRLYNCLQEERMRFVEIESTFRNLQLMHSQAHEELISLIAELQNAAQILKDAEARNQGLQDVSQNVDVENRSLNDLSLSPAASVGNLQHEISRLRDMSLQLVEEFGIRVDQRNALLHEIYRLKEELNDLNRRLRDLTEQINSLGLNPECFGSSVKELQDEILKLREISRNEKIEKVSFFKKLESLESVIGENNSLKEALSNLHAELGVLRRSIAVFEESFQSVVGEKLALVDEKGVLGSQLQIMSQKFEISLEKNGCLDKSLSEACTEVEGLRAKLKILESLFQFLDNEKSGLITERDTLASQFTITTRRLRDLENKYKHLEERHSGLENDKESVLQKLEDLSASLDVQKQEHAWFTQSSETRLAGVEAQILLLQDEGGNKKKEFEGLDKSVNFQVEIFILKKCIQDLEDKNLSLLVDCEKFLRVCKLSKRMISELELEKTEQQMEVKSLNDHVMDLRMMMSQICNALDIDSVDERPYEDGKAQLVMNQVLCKLEETRTALCSIQDENQQLAIEKSVLVTVLGQLKEEAANLVTQKNTIDWELRIITTQLSALQNNTQKFWQLNDELSLKLRERDHKEKSLTDEMEGLFGNLLDFQGACEDLKCENFKLLEEQRYLLKKLLEVEEQKHSLEGESPVILGEALSLSFLSVILMNIVNEKCVEQKEVSENLDKLHGLNIALRERVSELEGNMEMEKLENFLLKESFERSERGLKAEKIVSEQLNNEIACKKNLLCQTGMELLGSEQKLTAMKNEKAAWHKMIEDLDREYHAVKVIKEDQEKQILKLTEENDHWNNEDERLHETIKRLEADLFKLDDANEATKIREERLRSELKKRKNEAELWQNEAESLFGEFQASAVQESFLEEKLSEVCESFLDQMSSKDIEIGQLNEKLSAFESENGELKFQLASYDPAIADIKDCMTSLENHMSLQRRFRKAENIEIKAVGGSNSETKKFQKLSQDQIPRFKSNPDLQGSQARILAAMRKIDELDSQSNLSGENVRTGNWWPDDGLKPMRSMPRIGERGNELFTKDIMLDHMFESSSHRISKSEHFKANPALELWETTDQNHSIGLKAGKYPIGDASLGILIDKELGADILEISDSFREHTRREGNKRKILERLSSDAQKLTNLGITVQDLRRKVEFTEKGRKGKGIEYDTVRLQLEEVEEDILKLFDTNGKLMKDAQENFSSLKGKSASKLEESGSFRKRRVSEQARKGSEKIGRLQSVVQKIQFLLLKLDDEKEKKARTKIPERKARVLLQDYLYGAIRTNYSRQKKNHFCSCAQPPTRGD